MKKPARTLAVAAALALALAACSKKLPDDPKPQAGPAPAPAPVEAPAPLAAPAAAMRGTVVETMDAASYTYVQVDLGDRKVWAAAPKFAVKVGDTVSIPEGMPMENYHSETLKRDFDLVYFVAAIGVGDAAAAAPGAPPQLEQPLPEGLHPKVDAAQAARDAQVDFKGITKAGKTVAEVYAEQAALGGTEVAIRGKVVKFNPQIMGKNWIHLQDGTGAAGTNDLTITTMDAAQVGDTVVAKGKISINRDFGMGYRYGVIMEDAALSVE